jgi:peptide/nickel transport system ATP-binding protein
MIAGTPDLSADVGESTEAVAAIRDLSVGFRVPAGRVEAVRSLSLDIAPGEVLALVGESGSGKSVLSMSILGLVNRMRGSEVSGSVVVAGVDMLDNSDRTRRAVRRHALGAVFQDPLTSLNPTMTIGRQLTERGIDRAHAVQNLYDAGVPEPERRLDHYPHELSGGLRQRVMIAMALGTARPEAEEARPEPDAPGSVVITDARGVPKLIVADEPTTALDVSVQAQVVLLFDRLRREHGCAVLFVTHDLGVAASIADRIGVMYAGRMAEIGPAADLLARPSHPYTRALLNARISVDSARGEVTKAIPGAPPNPLELPPGCPYAPRCPNVRDDCRRELVALRARPPQDGPGEVACLHPHERASRAQADAALVAEPRRAVNDADDQLALQLKGVSKTFHLRTGSFGRRREDLHAVSDVSLELRRGSVLALVGESGSGKTTTLRIACGLLDPDAGELTTWGGRPQLVFQDAGSSLTPWMTVSAMLQEQLRLKGVARGERRVKALELLERVGLDARAADAKPRMLSGGQRQRAAIARALASEPSVLICDEPVSALDASLAIRVLELLEELRRDLGVALLIVTHDLGVARHVADDVAIMYRGEVVEQGPAADVFAHPAHPYTEGLLAAIPSTEPGRLAPKLRGEPPSPIGRIQGCPFRSRCPYAQQVCVTDAPPLARVGTQFSACHFRDAILAGQAESLERA